MILQIAEPFELVHLILFDDLADFEELVTNIVDANIGSPFRFLSVNVPNLHRIEKLAPKVERVWNFTDHGSCPPELPAVTGETNVVATLPTAGEIWDALCSALSLPITCKFVFL